MSESKPEPEQNEAVERARLNSETAKIAWHELQRFFAQGNAVAVAPQLDLVEVAYQIACDNKACVERWMEQQQVGPVSDQQAREWLDANALVWSVVVRPWVLVQPILQEGVMQTDNGATD
ncbi:MAG: DUF2288 domain-containing protein [Gammaproteobacteria bacterium]|nr:DUF2288 domain-containing protein [Gammaproteobacteria bacterium]NND55408.1 DUF2288 domain-containing protein [Gammaproteobacteria bacterium]